MTNIVIFIEYSLDCEFFRCICRRLQSARLHGMHITSLYNVRYVKKFYSFFNHIFQKYKFPSQSTRQQYWKIMFLLSKANFSRCLSVVPSLKFPQESTKFFYDLDPNLTPMNSLHLLHIENTFTQEKEERNSLHWHASLVSVHFVSLSVKLSREMRNKSGDLLDDAGIFGWAADMCAICGSWFSITIVSVTAHGNEQGSSRSQPSIDRKRGLEYR